MKGHLKTLKEQGNFGFIRAENNGEYFFHKSDFNGHWDDLVNDFKYPGFGQIPMSFEVVDSPKGPRANKVKRMDHPNNAA